MRRDAVQYPVEVSKPKYPSPNTHAIAPHALPGRRFLMSSLALTVFHDSQLGIVEELPRTGSPLENPFVYDSVAQDLKAMAENTHALEIVDEHVSRYAGEALIDRLRFRRVR